MASGALGQTCHCVMISSEDLELGPRAGFELTISRRLQRQADLDDHWPSLLSGREAKLTQAELACIQVRKTGMYLNQKSQKKKKLI